MFQFKFKAALFQFEQREPQFTPLFALPPKIGRLLLRLPGFKLMELSAVLRSCSSPPVTRFTVFRFIVLR